MLSGFLVVGGDGFEPLFRLVIFLAGTDMIVGSHKEGMTHTHTLFFFFFFFIFFYFIYF